MTDSPTHSSPADPTRLEAFLADQLPAEERAALEDHLADCTDSRQQLLARHREALETASTAEAAAVPTEWLDRVRSPGSLAPGSAAPDSSERSASKGSGPARWMAIAALLMVAVGGGWWAMSTVQRPLDGATSEASPPVLRHEEPMQTLELVAPDDGAALPTGPIELRWTPVIDAIDYRVLILDAAGAPLTWHRTDATAWTWPSDEAAAFWYVEAALTDGTRLESEPRRLGLESAR